MEYSVSDLEKKAKGLRRKVFEFNKETGLKHYGGALSMIEIITALYDVVLQDDDKFILSKGHAAPPYFIKLRERGYNPTISGHPDIDPANGIYCTTGSLGHGLPFGIGMALARKMHDKPGHFYVLMSDGECQEEITWGALMHGAKFNLDNVTAILDCNKVQSSGYVDDILPLGDLERKFQAFDWDVSRINGHRFEEIIPALQKRTVGKPRIIIADTIKGKGVSFMEHSEHWHSESPTEEQWKQGYEELS